MLIDEERKYKRTFNFRESILPKMKELVVQAFEAVKEKIDRNNRKLCFEIFGFDFMIDSASNVWLIEINSNPCLEESSPLLEKLIPRMMGIFLISILYSYTLYIDDALKLTVDKIFNEKTMNENVNRPSLFKVGGYNDCVNLWEYLVCLAGFKKV